jgi:hypothetical protein
MVIAEDENALAAHRKYLEALRLEEARQQAVRAGRGGKVILSGLRIAYLRLRGNM